MKKQAGVWIDLKKAIIVYLEDDTHKLKILPSEIESRERIPGETKWFTRFGDQFLEFSKRKENRLANKVKVYLKSVLDEIKDADEIVLFGPAGMKTELEKLINGVKAMAGKIQSVETADSMTDNQVVAWVKKYYAEKVS
jgi:hypothetical protein